MDSKEIKPQDWMKDHRFIFIDGLRGICENIYALLKIISDSDSEKTKKLQKVRLGIGAISQIADQTSLEEMRASGTKIGFVGLHGLPHIYMQVEKLILERDGLTPYIKLRKRGVCSRCNYLQCIREGIIWRA